MSRIYWILCVLSLLAGGCVAPVTYDHRGKTLAEKQRDTVECLATASQAASGAGGWSSDPALRSAIFQHARDQYFAMCLESRGWVRGSTSSPGPPNWVSAGIPGPSNWVSAEPDKDPERRCQQGAFYVMGYYDLWRDGRDSWWWQQALQRYQTTKGLDASDPEATTRLRTAIDEDLQAKGNADQWRRCLVEAGLTGM
jgi:hypothetical protein